MDVSVVQFPKPTFKSTKIRKAGKGYKLKGELTIHGVTKEVTLDATVGQALSGNATRCHSIFEPALCKSPCK